MGIKVNGYPRWMDGRVEHITLVANRRTEAAFTPAHGATQDGGNKQRRVLVDV